MSTADALAEVGLLLACNEIVAVCVLPLDTEFQLPELFTDVTLS